jgi:hypothetical protein
MNFAAMGCILSSTDGCHKSPTHPTNPDFDELEASSGRRLNEALGCKSSFAASLISFLSAGEFFRVRYQGLKTRIAMERIEIGVLPYC